MISIVESVPRKLSGKTSLFVKFDYNEQIVNIIKTFSPAIWDRKNLTWELQTSYLAKLLDTLTYIDDIQLTLYSEPESSDVSQNPLTDSEIKSFKYKPYNHQIDGINFLLKQKKGLLLDGCGLGKSLEIMYLAEALHSRGLIDHCLIICGVDSLRANWSSEIKKFSRESVVVLGEKITKTGKTVYDTIPKRVEQLKNKIDEFFVVVNIASLRSDQIVDAIMKGPNKFGMIACDEIHKVATKSSQQGSNLLKLKSEYKVAATGTPISNSVLSVYIPLSWTENDYATLTNYKSFYCNFGGYNNSQVISYKNLDVLKDEIDSCSIRRTFDQVRGDMPLKTIEYEIVEMSEEHKKFYEAIKQGVKEEADKIELNTSNLLSLMTRLRQASSSPSVLTSQSILSSKVERAVDIAEELLDQNEKVVILCNFIESAEKLAELLAKYNPVLCTGKQSVDYMEKGVESFRFSNTTNLLIGTHQKVGVGFSFPECHYGIFIDQPFTPSQQKQSEDRIYRITSDQPVFIKVLLCKDTVDMRVKEIVDEKQDLSDFVIDNIETERFTKKMKDIIMEL